MKQVVFSARARRDLKGIWLFIVLEDETAAKNVEAAILTNAALLARHPLLGRQLISRRGHSLHVWPAQPFSNYRIVYRVKSELIEILRVLHGKRSKVWESL